MDKDIVAAIERHFAFESPELVNRIAETFNDEFTWEAPARKIKLNTKDELLAQYKKIVAGVVNPEMEMLHRVIKDNEAFDDRIVRFTAAKDNVWGFPENQKAELRLAHYFKIINQKVSHEIAFEIWNI